MPKSIRRIVDVEVSDVEVVLIQVGKKAAAAMIRFGGVQEAQWLVDNLNNNIPQGMATPVNILYTRPYGAGGGGPRRRRVGARLPAAAGRPPRVASGQSHGGRASRGADGNADGGSDCDGDDSNGGHSSAAHIGGDGDSNCGHSIAAYTGSDSDSGGGNRGATRVSDLTLTRC